MTIGLPELRKLFVERYESMKAHLARRLGSAEMAGDALHDAYIRLATREPGEAVRHPQAYVLNAAVHAAIDRMRSQARELSASEIDALYEIEDAAPGPAETAAARLDLEQMVKAMEALPPRQRDILFSSRVEGLSREDLAKRWGISPRMVNKELQAAHEFCVRQMRR